MGRRRLAVGTAFVLALAVVGCSPPGPSAPELQKGQQLADATLTSLDGGSVQFHQLTSGKVALVDVWATWCAPCIASMPHLQALHNRFKDDGFTVVGVMIDTNATKIGPDFMKKKRLSDADRRAALYGAAKLEREVGALGPRT